MKVKIKNTNDLVVIGGRIGFIEPKFSTLTNVSVGNKLYKTETKATEWCHINFSNPKDGNTGNKWADFANNNLQKGMFLFSICYEKQNGEYTNYYVNACNDVDGMFTQIAQTDLFCIVGKIKNINKINENLVEISLLAKNIEYKIAFLNLETSNMKLANLTSYLQKEQTIGLIATKKIKGQHVNWYANAVEFGPK